jgi:hypothetical protein
MPAPSFGRAWEPVLRPLGQRLAPRTRFVVLCPKRSGSELLVGMLDSHPDIVCDSELLEGVVRRPLDLVRAAALRARRKGAKAWGFKLPISHLRLNLFFADPSANWLQVLAEDGFVIIRLRRRDLLAQTLSMLHAQRTGRWHFKGRADETFERFEVDPAELLAELYTNETDDRLADEMLRDLPHHLIVYEEDLIGPDAQRATGQTIAQWLGLPPAELASNFTARAPRAPLERVSNAEEVVDVLSRTRYAPLVTAAS